VASPSEQQSDASPPAPAVVNPPLTFTLKLEPNHPYLDARNVKSAGREIFGLGYWAENFLSRDVEKRWRDAFGFGLIHGFGFASALQEFGLPRSALVPALASFNIGVEIGQIAIVSLVVPALLGMDRLLASDRGVAARPIRPAPAVYPSRQ
jgi:hypothetical protein